MKTFIRVSQMVRKAIGVVPKIETRLCVIDCLWIDAFVRGYFLFDQRGDH